MKLSSIHIAILESGAEGQSMHYETRFVLNGRAVTRQVKTLRKAGLIEVTYYARGGISACATDAGRESLLTATGAIA